MVIYKTINLINNIIYVGQDSKNNPQYLGSGLYILRAIKKYGKENFKKEILCECNSKEELDQKEIYWIKNLNSKVPNGYNFTDGGGGTLGDHRPKSEEHNRKNRESQLGNKNHMYGKKSPKHSIYMKEKMKGNNYHLGFKHSEETKKKISMPGEKNPFYGKHHSEETRKRLSNTHKRKNLFKNFSRDLQIYICSI